MTKSLSALIGLVLFFVFSLQAQRSAEVGIFLGASNYMGDLSPYPVAANETNMAFGGHYRYMLNSMIGLKGSVTYGKISGADANIPLVVPTLNVRRWKMEAHLLETALQAEWHMLASSRFNNAGLYRRQASPYIGIGLGLVFGESEVQVGEKDKVRFPEPDDKSAFLVFPLTLGIRFDVVESVILSGEFGFRATLSDYLDGISTYGNPNANDHFFFAGISVLYLIEADYGPSYRN